MTYMRSVTKLPSKAIRRLRCVTEDLLAAQDYLETAMDAFDFDTETAQWAMLSDAAEAIQKAQSGLRFYCLGCNEDTSGGEYYMVRDEVWAASGLGGHDGMLCLACLEMRIERPLRPDDFTAICPSKEAWQRHVATRGRSRTAPPSRNATLPEQGELL